MPLSSQGRQGRGECRSARGQFTVLAKRRGLLWSCGGRGLDVGGGGDQLDPGTHATGTGRGVKATGNLESPVGLLRDLDRLGLAAAPIYRQEA